MGINIAMLAAKIPLNVLLMFGLGDWQGLGAPGCAAATAIISWLGLLTHLAVLYFGKRYQPLNIFKGSWTPHSNRIGHLLKLGIPTAGGYLLEVTSFTFMALWLARLGASVSASHQIAANLTALIYMVGLAIANATSNLTARELGGGRTEEARAYALIGIKLAAIAAIVVGLLVALFNLQIASLYSTQPEVVASASTLLLWVAAYHFFDVGQTMCTFILRAYRVVMPTVLVYFVCLWLIGLGLGYSLSFGNLGGWFTADQKALLQTTPTGFWLGGLVGVACATFALYALLLRQLRQPE